MNYIQKEIKTRLISIIKTRRKGMSYTTAQFNLLDSKKRVYIQRIIKQKAK